MWPDSVSNPGPVAHESDELPTALRGPADCCLAFSLSHYIEMLIWPKNL